MHFPTAFGPSQAVSFALECNLRGFFSSGFVLKHPYIHKHAFTCRNPKKVSLWDSYKSERASSVHRSLSRPVAAPTSFSLQLSSLKADHENIFSFSQPWATAFWEDKHNIHLIAGENPMAFFQWFKVMLSLSTIFALLHSKSYCNIWHVFC